MGVLTCVYQVPVDVLKQFQKSTKKLDFLIFSQGVSAEDLGQASTWKPNACAFDKTWEDLMSILRQLGHHKAGSILEHGGSSLHASSSDIYCRYWRKTKLKQVQASLKGITATQLKEKAAKKADLTNWNGDPAYDMLDYYLQSFNQLSAMIDNAIEQGDALIAVSS